MGPSELSGTTIGCAIPAFSAAICGKAASPDWEAHIGETIATTQQLPLLPCLLAQAEQIASAKNEYLYIMEKSETCREICLQSNSTKVAGHHSEGLHHSSVNLLLGG